MSAYWLAPHLYSQSSTIIHMRSLILLLIFLVSIGLDAQSIRKNYKEMTQSEKDLLVSAFYQLRNGPDLILDLANFHATHFSSAPPFNSSTPIHFNLPGNPGRDVFLAWHRRQIFEVEQAMQDINPRASIPFWDWTVDRSSSSSSELWRDDFMGSFNNNWNLNRQLGLSSVSLPTSSQVNSVQSETDWLTYTNNFERGAPHANPHTWVGGSMSSASSPIDPIFYLHHGMVDKLWQEWVDANNITPSSNIYQITNMPRYDGTYSFNGQTLSSVNPDNIVDGK